MSRESLDLQQAAEHVHLDANILKHAAQRGELPAVEHSGSWYFTLADLDDWAQRQLLGAKSKELVERHRLFDRDLQQMVHSEMPLAHHFPAASLDLAIPAKTRMGAIRDMTDLAIRSGLVYDEEGLFKALVAREEAASTAVEGGVAFLHPRLHDPYFFEQTFIAYGRAIRPIFFGAPDDEPTRHFFVVCATDRAIHLHLLAHLAVLVKKGSLSQRLDELTDLSEFATVLKAAEDEAGV